MRLRSDGRLPRVPKLLTKKETGTIKLQIGYKIDYGARITQNFNQSHLFQAVELLKVGGKLVYSTCTVTIEENEGMVKWALQKHPCLQLVPAHPLLGGPGLCGHGLDDQQRYSKKILLIV